MNPYKGFVTLDCPAMNPYEGFVQLDCSAMNIIKAL